MQAYTPTGKPSLLRMFLLSMVGISVLFSLMVVFIWFSTSSYLARERLLVNQLLPELDAVHHLTAATAGLQAQGFLLRSSNTEFQLARRRDALQLTIDDIAATLSTMTSVEPLVLNSLRESVANITSVAVGLTQVRKQQLKLKALIRTEMPDRLAELIALDSKVKQEVARLTDELLIISESMEAVETDHHRESKSEHVFDDQIAEYEAISLAIQDHLLFSQDVIALKAVVEKVPLLTDDKSIVLALQNRDLVVSALASRSIYISSTDYDDSLLTNLRELYASMNGGQSLFVLQEDVVAHEAMQSTMHSLLREYTRVILEQTGSLRFETRSKVSELAEETLEGLYRSRVLPLLLNVVALFLLGAVTYWLLYRSTLLPLVSITRQLDDVGSEFFPDELPEYYLKELSALSSATKQLDGAQKAMQLKDFQLQQINRDLLRANEELQQFAHIASHDLQEPLRKLQQFSDLLKEDYGASLDKEATFFIDTIHSSAQRMSVLIKETLAYSRAGSGNQKLVNVDLNKLLVQLREEMEVAIREAHGEFSIEPMPVVIANELGMAQLFRNLMINGLKYSKPDTPARIRISTDRDAGAQSGLVHIRVEDNGMGIADKYLQRIFIPFERLHGNSVPGTGLGLAICKKVCESHGWRLEVSSELGLGTTFAIGIPLSSLHTS